MTWRKWLVRGMVLLIAGGVVLLGVLYQRFTNPEAIRQQVLDKLSADFSGAQVSVERAEFRPFGGIEVHEIRMARRDDLDRADFAYIPTAVLYHDKEQVLKGRMQLRKIELHRPRLRLVRQHDGRWNVTGLMGAPLDPSQPMPTLMIHGGHLIVEDKQAAPGTPPLEMKNVELTIVNDPQPVVSIAGSGTCAVLGPVQIKATMQRGDPHSLQLSIEANGIPIGPALVQHIAGAAPEAAEHLRQLRGQGSLSATVRLCPHEQPPFHYDVRFKLQDAAFSHNSIPWDLDRIDASFHCADGHLLLADVKGYAGTARLRAQLKDLKLGPDIGASLADAVRELEVQAEKVPINEELFARLPPSLRSIQKDYQPSGTATVGLTFRRQVSGEWRRCWTFQPQNMTANYRLFQYPIKNVQGYIMYETVSAAPTPSTLMAAMQSGLSATEPADETGTPKAAAPQDRIDINLRGTGGGTAVFLKGTVQGHESAPGLTLDLWADNVPIDDALYAALPEQHQTLARGFHPTGKVDIKAFFRKLPGATEFNNRYLLQFHHATVKYDPFPYPLENVVCTLDLLPNRWEFRNFVGTHRGGTIRASGGSQPLKTTRVSYPGAPEPAPTRRISVSVKGENIALDEDFEQALSPGRETLAKAWKMFALNGRMNFQADIEDLPNQPQDVDVTVSIGGCRMKPSFFQYALEDVSATLRCSRHGVQVVKLRGRHGQSQLAVDKVTVILKPTGGYWAKLDTLHCSPLVPDDDLLQALPAPLRKGLISLNLKDPFALKTLLVVDQTAEPGALPVLYWDGSLGLQNATVNVGLPLTGVTGVVSLQGRHNGHHLEDVAGNLMLERAVLLNQPLQKIHSRIQVWKDSPDILRFKDLKCSLYGGQVGGEARVEFGSIFRYELDLKALQMKLEEFGRNNFGSTAELQGLATAGLHLSGEGTELAGLKGNGKIEVRDGKMYRLPLLLDLLKWLNLRLPDRTAFEQAEINFGIVGPRVDVHKLELFGNPISVRGAGTMNLDGSNLNLDLNADWGRMGPIMPPVLRYVSREVSNQLLRIKVRGSVGNVKFEQELVPMVVDPLKKVFTGMQPGS